MVRWLSGYETRLLLRAGIKSPISVGLKQPEAGKGVPAAHPYSVGVGCCLFDRLEEVVIGPENAGGLCGPHPAITLTRRRISLLSSVRRRRRKGFPEGSPSRPSFFVFKGRCPASGILWRETGDVEREAAFADAGGRACRPYGNGEEGTRETSAPVLLFMDNAIIILM